jgi:hypothetical protein
MFSVTTNSNVPIKNCTVGVSGGGSTGLSGPAKAGVGVGVAVAALGIGGLAGYAIYQHFFHGAGTGVAPNVAPGPTGGEGNMMTGGEKILPNANAYPVDPSSTIPGGNLPPPSTGMESQAYTPMNGAPGGYTPGPTGADMHTAAQSIGNMGQAPLGGGAPAGVAPGGAAPAPGVGGGPVAFVPPLIPPQALSNAAPGNPNQKGTAPQGQPGGPPQGQTPMGGAETYHYNFQQNMNHPGYPDSAAPNNMSNMPQGYDGGYQQAPGGQYPGVNHSGYPTGPDGNFQSTYPNGPAPSQAPTGGHPTGLQPGYQPGADGMQSYNTGGNTMQSFHPGNDGMQSYQPYNGGDSSYYSPHTNTSSPMPSSTAPTGGSSTFGGPGGPYHAQPLAGAPGAPGGTGMEGGVPHTGFDGSGAHTGFNGGPNTTDFGSGLQGQGPGVPNSVDCTPGADGSGGNGPPAFTIPTGLGFGAGRRRRSDEEER